MSRVGKVDEVAALFVAAGIGRMQLLDGCRI